MLNTIGISFYMRDSFAIALLCSFLFSAKVIKKETNDRNFHIIKAMTGVIILKKLMLKLRTFSVILDLGV